MNARSPSETKPSKLRTRLREATCAAILDAAENVFAERGLDAAHMNDIAAGAGVAVGTVYNHFKDRDALLAALMENRRQELLAITDQFLDEPSLGDFRADLTELVGRMGAFFNEHHRFHRILHLGEIGINATAYPTACEQAPQLVQALYARVEKLIRRGLKQKALRPELGKFYPSLLLGILRSLRMQLILNGDKEHMPLDEVVRFFMEGAGR